MADVPVRAWGCTVATCPFVIPGAGASEDGARWSHRELYPFCYGGVVVPLVEASALRQRIAGEVRRRADAVESAPCDADCNRIDGVIAGAIRALADSIEKGGPR